MKNKIEAKPLNSVEQYIDIWKFFSQRKEELQARLYMFITWSVGALIGFVTFALKEWCSLLRFTKSRDVIFIIAIAVWIGLVLYFSLRINHHKNKNEERQKRAAEKIEGLQNEIINDVFAPIKTTKPNNHEKY